ncbi:MAG: DUF2723 domain-containing protein [Caldiserica bacterium]|nr:DUF2723 domain-containing protein [Caldisericota bacterium]
MIPFVVFLFTLALTVTNEDSGDLIIFSYVLGIPHLPGYPLYTRLGKLFTYIPIFVFPGEKFPDGEEVKGFVQETIEKRYLPETIGYMIIESIIGKNLPKFPVCSNLVFLQRKFGFRLFLLFTRFSRNNCHHFSSSFLRVIC